MTPSTSTCGARTAVSVAGNARQCSAGQRVTYCPLHHIAAQRALAPQPGKSAVSLWARPGAWSPRRLISRSRCTRPAPGGVGEQPSVRSRRRDALRRCRRRTWRAVPESVAACGLRQTRGARGIPSRTATQAPPDASASGRPLPAIRCASSIADQGRTGWFDLAERNKPPDGGILIRHRPSTVRRNNTALEVHRTTQALS